MLPLALGMRGASRRPDEGPGMIVAFAQEENRGAERLLEHCAALSALEDRLPASSRLESRVGRELARLLVFALAGRHATRRGLRRRGGRKPKVRT